MGKTRLHIEKAKYSQGDKTSARLSNYFDRSNNDWGEFRMLKKNKEDKQLRKEMKEAIRKRFEQ